MTTSIGGSRPHVVPYTPPADVVPYTPPIATTLLIHTLTYRDGNLTRASTAADKLSNAGVIARAEAGFLGTTAVAAVETVVRGVFAVIVAAKKGLDEWATDQVSPHAPIADNAVRKTNDCGGVLLTSLFAAAINPFVSDLTGALGLRRAD